MATTTPKAAAVHLWGLGANITAIPLGEKRPSHRWQRWEEEHQPKEFIDSLRWRVRPEWVNGEELPPHQTVGVICGVNAWRWFDVDARKGPDGTKLPVPESVRDAMLEALGLEQGYAWCGRSKSGKGWHIAFRCAGELPEDIAAAVGEMKASDGGGAGVMIGVPSPDYAEAFDHLELRWHSCQTVLPGPDGYTGRLPDMPPTEVAVAQAVAAFRAVSLPKARKAAPVAPSVAQPAATPANRGRYVWDDQVRARIAASFDLVTWFCQELGGDARQERDGEIRILGNHGLLVNPGKGVWHIFGEDTGGGWVEAIEHTRYGGLKQTGAAFFSNVVPIAAAFAGVALEPEPAAERHQDGATPSVVEAVCVKPDQIELLNSLNRTDMGNAEALAALRGDELRYCHNRKKWLVWAGSRWRIDEDGYADRAMTAVARQRYHAAAAIEDVEARKHAAGWAISSENSSKIEAALKRAERLEHFATTIDHYDADPLLAATPTATLDLRTGGARAPKRSDHLTMALGASFDPAATCPRWRRFLDEVFAGDTALIAYIQRAAGYSLTGDTSEQKVFLCHGGGANGKSVFLKVLAWLLGDYSANATFDTFDAGRRSEATNDLAALKGCRLVTMIETEEDRRLAEAKIKAVTGGDLVTARFLYGEFFSYRPQFKIWLAMNHKPVIKGTDRGIWRRLQLIPFTQSFEGREDRTLAAQLRAELPGILNWALEGLRAWHEQGLGECGAIADATREYQEESDQVGRWLADHTTMGDSKTVDPRLRVKVAAAYADYSRWASENGEWALSQTLWGRRLTERGIRRDRLSGSWHYFGFGLLHSPGTPPPPPDEGSEDDGAQQLKGCDPFDPFDPKSGGVPMRASLDQKTPQNGSNGSNGSRPLAAECAASPIDANEPPPGCKLGHDKYLAAEGSPAWFCRIAGRHNYFSDRAAALAWAWEVAFEVEPELAS